LIVIADPAGRRWQQFAEEADRCGENGCGFNLEVVSWSRIIEQRGCLDGLPEFDQPALVRIDSTGENFELTRLLLAADDRSSGDAPSKWSQLEYRKGCLVHPSLVWRGWKTVLAGLEESFDERLHLQPLARPRDIATMFDKTATSKRLQSAGLPCPDELDANRFENGSQILDAIHLAGFETAFAKLNTGSSATGIAAINAGNRPVTAQTSMLQIDGEIFNTLRLQTVSEEQLIPLLDFLLKEGLCLQRGIFKARIDGQEFDLRVIVIDGQPEFTIFRLSQSPMTNLHFGGRRGDVERCRSVIPTRVWLDAMDSCVEAAALFEAHMVGVDLVFERGFFRHFLLEVNAFGDFFPGWTDNRGRTIYQAQLESLRKMADS
jgi:hypothetical protein